MDQQTLDSFKNLFLNLKKEHCIQEQVSDSLWDRNQGDTIDIVNEEREQKIELKLRGRDNLFIRKVDQALKRIHDGIYGECSDCLHEIGLERLHARPTATLCIECKEEQERKEDHMLYSKKSHTLGKTFAASNIIALPILNEEINKEKVLIFNKDRASIGLPN